MCRPERATLGFGSSRLGSSSLLCLLLFCVWIFRSRFSWVWLSLWICWLANLCCLRSSFSRSRCCLFSVRSRWRSSFLFCTSRAFSSRSIYFWIRWFSFWIRSCSFWASMFIACSRTAATFVGKKNYVISLSLSKRPSGFPRFRRLFSLTSVRRRLRFLWMRISF